MNTTYKEKSVENAKKAKTFAGKDSSFPPKGAKVWISMELSKRKHGVISATTHDTTFYLKKALN